MIERTLTLLFLLTASISFSKWEKITDRAVTTFDMLNAKVGLAAVVDGAPLVMRIENGKEFGIINPSGEVTTLTIINKDVAYMGVNGDGVYKSSGNWEFWKRIFANQNSNIVGVTSAGTFIQGGKKLYYSADELAFTEGTGIDTAQEIRSVVGFGSYVVAASKTSLYYSSNSGAGWVRKVSTLGTGGTLFLDSATHTIFAGGKPMLVSRDSGKTWKTWSTPIFPTIDGNVYGSKDCSGAFYVINVLPGLYDVSRSTDHGQSIQNVGPGMDYQYGFNKLVVTDRGSTLHWQNTAPLWQSARLFYTVGGLDGAISDSVAVKLSIRADTGVVASACPGAQPVPFKITVGFSECTGVRIDNITIEGNGFAMPSAPKTIAASETSFPATYKASKVGYDTARIKVIFRSLSTNQTETKTGVAIGRGVSGPAKLSLSTDNIAFGILDTGDHFIKSVSLLNFGCDAFRIDSVVSSLPEVFLVSGYSFPMYVSGGNRAYFNITFSPSKKQRYLESLEVYTSEGIRYVTLTGEGTFDPGSASVTDPEQEPAIELSSNVITLGQRLEIILHAKDVRRARIYTVSGVLMEEVVLYPGPGVTCDLARYPTGKYIVQTAGELPLPFFVFR